MIASRNLLAYYALEMQRSRMPELLAIAILRQVGRLIREKLSTGKIFTDGLLKSDHTLRANTGI